jgi:tyrosinase
MVFGRLTLTGLFTSALVVADSLASPHGVGIKEKRQNAPLAVTGVQGSGLQPRLEIRDLQKNGDMWNMYVLGLSRMQSLDQSDYQSYFQLAGR